MKFTRNCFIHSSRNGSILRSEPILKGTIRTAFLTGVIAVALSLGIIGTIQAQRGDSAQSHHLFLSFIAGTGNAPESDIQQYEDSSPMVVQTEEVEPTESALLTKARTEGKVRILVGLALPDISFQGEDGLGDAAVAVQRAAIATAQQGLVDTLANHDANIYTSYVTMPYLALEADESALNTLSQSPLVIDIQEDIEYTTMLDSSTEVIGAPAAWTSGFKGAGQAVVIIDTGIDANHPFFGNRVVAEACFSSAGISLCPDGQPRQTGPGSADATTSNCNGGSLCNHGTHVAGIAAGSSSTFNGVAPEADIIAIQVFSRAEDPENCPTGCLGASTSDINSALEYTYLNLSGQHDIASVNMSLGGFFVYDDQSLCDSLNSSTKIQIDNLRSVDIATVIASGNWGQKAAISSPACISSAIAVGATTNNDTVAGFSNMHDMVELLAPGVNINSAVPGGTYQRFSGTSMAAPHVAGAWALLKGASPSASVNEVLDNLQNSGVLVSDTRTGGSFTKPRIQLDAALDIPELTATPTTPTPTPSRTPTSTPTPTPTVVESGRPDLTIQSVELDSECNATITFTNIGVVDTPSLSYIEAFFHRGRSGWQLSSGRVGTVAGTRGTLDIPFPANGF